MRLLETCAAIQQVFGVTAEEIEEFLENSGIKTQSREGSSFGEF